MIAWHNSHMTSKELHFFICKRLIATKLDKVVIVYDIGLHAQGHMIFWSHEIRIFVLWQRENVISPIPQVLWTTNWKGWWLGHGATEKIISPLGKCSFHSYFFYPSNVPLILHKVTVRLFLLEEELGSPLLAFLNLYLTLHEIHASLW